MFSDFLIYHVVGSVTFLWLPFVHICILCLTLTFVSVPLCLLLSHASRFSLPVRSGLSAAGDEIRFVFPTFLLCCLLSGPHNLSSPSSTTSFGFVHSYCLRTLCGTILSQVHLSISFSVFTVAACYFPLFSLLTQSSPFLHPVALRFSVNLRRLLPVFRRGGEICRGWRDGRESGG